MSHDRFRSARASTFLVGSVALFALLSARGCKAGSDAPATQSRIVIRLAHNDWLGANMNDAIAKILLEEKLGYAVDLVTSDTSGQWPSLASGALHVALEVWPSG